MWESPTNAGLKTHTTRGSPPITLLAGQESEIKVWIVQRPGIDQISLAKTKPKKKKNKKKKKTKKNPKKKTKKEKKQQNPGK